MLAGGKHATSAGRSLLPLHCTALLHTGRLLSKEVSLFAKHAISTWTPAKYSPLLHIVLCRVHSTKLLALKEPVPFR
jgi:hypothetical protein